MSSEKNIEVDESTNKLHKQSSSLEFDSKNVKKTILDIKNDTGYFTKNKRREVEHVLNELMNTSDNMNHLIVIIYKLFSQSTATSRNNIFDLILWSIDNRFTINIDQFKSMSTTNIKEILMDIYTPSFESIINLQNKLEVLNRDFKVIKYCRFYFNKGRVSLSVGIPKKILPEEMLQYGEEQKQLNNMISFHGISFKEIDIKDVDMLSPLGIADEEAEFSGVFKSTMKNNLSKQSSSLKFDSNNMKEKILDIKNDTGYFTKKKRQEVEHVLNELMNTSENMNHLIVIIYKLFSQSTATSRNDIFDLILWAIDNMISKQVYDVIANEYFDQFQAMSITSIKESRNTSMKEISSLLSVLSITEDSTGKLNIANKSNSGDFQSAEVITKDIPKIRTPFSKLTIGYTMEDIRAYRRKLQECIDCETLKFIKSFEFYYDKDGKPHISLSIINPSEKAHLDSEVEVDKKSVKSMLSDFGLAEEDICIDYELSSGDFQPAMETEQDDEPPDGKPTVDEPPDDKPTEDIVNVAAILTNLGDTGVCNLGSHVEGTFSRGLVIKLEIKKFKGLEKIIPNLDIKKEIYANVGASHTVPRIMNLKQKSLLIANELNVTGQIFNVRNRSVHLYNDLDVFVIRNKTKSGSPIHFEALNTINGKYTHWNGVDTEDLRGNITHVWSGDVKNGILQIGDTVYFQGKHNKSYGTVTAFPSQSVETPNTKKRVEHYMIKCELKVQQGDLGGLLFKRNPPSLDNNFKNEFIAVGICSYFLPITGENYGDISYFVPLTDLDQSIYEFPQSITKDTSKIRTLYSKSTIGYTMEDIHDYRRKLQECIDCETLKFIKSFEFYYDKDGKPHISLSVIDLSEKAHLDSEVEVDKKSVKSMLSDFGLAEEDICIDYELSSGDFQLAMETEHDKPTVDEPPDDKPTVDEPPDDKPTVEDIVNVAAILTNLGDSGVCNLGSQGEGTFSRGLVIKLKLTKFKGLERIIPDLDITKEIYANVGASHTVPRIMNLKQKSLLSYIGIGTELISHELNVAGQIFNVRNRSIHLYNDLDVFVIRNKTKSGSPIHFEALNTINGNYTHWNGVDTEDLRGNITHVWSGDVNNGILQIGDTVYFQGKHNKSYGTVTAFPSQSVGEVEHYLIKCKLRIQQGDSGGLLFKHNPASRDNNNKDEFIAVGICSYFPPIAGQNYGEISYFVPLTDLDKSIYELPVPPPSIPTP